MEDMSLTVNIGSLGTPYDQIRFELYVDAGGAAHLKLIASDPSSSRKLPIVLRLDQEGYNQLKALIDRTDQTIATLNSSGQMKQMAILEKRP